MFKGKGMRVLVLSAAVFLLAAANAVEARGRIGIVAVEGQYSNGGSWQEIVEALGYGSEFIKEDLLADSGKLNAFDCIILPYRHSFLYEAEYEALAGYVREGGTLFMIHTAGYWMAENPENRVASPRRGIRGGGPVGEATGARIGSPYLGRVAKFRVVERNCYTEGLPDEFEYRTRPAYDVNNPLARSEVLNLETEGADVLIEAEAYYGDEETPGTGAFLTVNSYGRGKTVWLGCRASTLILRYSESNILQVFGNVLKCSTE